MTRSTIVATYAAIITVFGFGFLSLGAKDCGSPGPVPPPQPIVDAAPPPPPPEECKANVLDSCGLAGERICQLGCRNAVGTPLWRTPGGQSFAEACRIAREDGRDWNPECLLRITDCAQVDRAFRSKEGACNL